jgi:hypothetical protein
VNAWKYKELQHIIMIQMNVLVVKLLQIKQIVVVVNVIEVILFLKQNHFRKILLDCTYRVHVEKLKKQIEREWGTTIDKAVDLTIKTIAKQWQAALSKSAANKEFYSELEKIFKTAKE